MNNEKKELKARITYTINVFIDDTIEVVENGFYNQWIFNRGDKENAQKVLNSIAEIFDKIK